MEMQNLLFYLYTDIEQLDKLQQWLYGLCEVLNLKGKILIADEGINGNITGKIRNTEKFMKKVNEHFPEMEFKLGLTHEHNFKKLIVRKRKEIVTLGEEVTLNNKADYIEPEELKKLLDEGKDVVLIDARNNYENKIGKFKGAITHDIDTFSQWPEAVKELKELKDKPIVTYCTGGIRCEKASAYMKEQGFTNVRQLHGGIIRYGHEIGNDHWEGKCFVFDTRGAIPIDPEKQNEPITQCELCNLPCDTYRNCTIEQCDRRHITCEQCSSILEGCCSKRCRGEKRITCLL